ncbi:MAG: nickel pincer cofactor biosynthesis protein LarC [Myxococcales bacterium]|nr:nickel pincer cofactor biosynthesis protein LarC [Myxococcales bacterium]
MGETKDMWLHFDCFSGISGDMTLGALLDLGVSLDELRDELAKLNLSGYRLSSERRMVGVMDAVKLHVLLDEQDAPTSKHSHAHTHEHNHTHEHHHEHAHEHHHEHTHEHSHEHTHEHTHSHGHEHHHEHNQEEHTHEHGHTHEDGHAHEHTHAHGHSHAHGHEHGEHRTYASIREMIAQSGLSERAKAWAQSIFLCLARAEAAVHGMSLDHVAFHEVGAVDSIVDIVGTAIGLDLLGVERVTCSPLPLSRGFVKCQHGNIPLPAPATLEILRGVPVYDSGLQKELVTPTGAAIVAALAEEFVGIPNFSLLAVGYGAGERILPDRPNLLRVMLGRPMSSHREQGDLLQIEANLDDMSPEQLAYVCERLWEVGVRDVWQGAIQMKKGRAAHQLSLLCSASMLGAVEDVLFRESSTLGFRFFPVARRVLEREFVEVETAWGPVTMKLGRRGDEIVQFAPEFDSCQRLSREKGVPLKQVYASALATWRARGGFSSCV